MFLTLAVLLSFLAATVTAWTYPNNAGIFPLLVGGVGSGLAAVHLISLAVRRRTTSPVVADGQADAESGDSTGHGRELGNLAWFAGLAIAVVLLGFWLGGPLWVFGFLLVGKREPIWLAATLALGLAVFLFGVFDRVMGIHLFMGLLLT